MAINHATLARKINQVLGEEVILQLYGALTQEEFIYLQLLMTVGQVNLHGDAHFGITINTPEGWTSEGF